MSDETSFQSNLVRRVQNMALGPSTPSNALVPVFEAVYNAIHAIQDRFDVEWFERGRITISLIDLDQNRPSFEIRDNGIGLDTNNYGSFRTYDSDHKARRGGKGLGRLSWLKVFDGAKVESVFINDTGCLKRRFILQLDNEQPLADYSLSETSGEAGTSVLLFNMKEQYALNRAGFAGGSNF